MARKEASVPIDKWPYRMPAEQSLGEGLLGDGGGKRPQLGQPVEAQVADTDEVRLLETRTLHQVGNQLEAGVDVTCQRLEADDGSRPDRGRIPIWPPIRARAS